MSSMIKYSHPFLAFRFIIEVKGDGSPVKASFGHFSGIQAETRMIEVRHGSDKRGVMTKIPSLTSYENVSLKKGVIGDNEFFEWILAAMPSSEAGPTGKELRRTIDVVALDGKGNRAITWTLKDAIPTGYQLSPMQSMESSLLTETLQFAISGFTRTVHTPPGNES